jgi:hypothetical protein
MKIRRIFDNIEIKLICLLLAVVLWLYANKLTGTWWPLREQVQLGEITFSEVPVKIIGIQKEWEADPEKIEIRCLATEVKLGNLQVVVSLTRADEEERWVTLTARNVKLPEGMDFIRSKPEKVQIIPLR